MRIKVKFNQEKLVVPLSDQEQSAKVEQLYTIIASRLQRKGIRDVRIASLTTSDGFTLDTHDVIQNVVRDSEELIALDYSEWIALQVPLCKTEWARVVQEDFVDDVYKFITVGYHEKNQLFVKFGTGYPNTKSEKILRLELFDVESLQHFAKPGKVLIGSKEGGEGNKKWKLEANFIVQDSGVAKEVEISVQSASDKRPVIKKVPFSFSATKTLVKGETVLVQEDAAYEYTAISTPSFTRHQHGPSYPETISPVSVKTEETKENKAAGNPNLEITQKGNVEPDQSWVNNGQFNNFFYSTFSILNKSKNEVSIRSVHSKYVNKEGKLVDAQTRVGQRHGYYNYAWNEPGILKIGAENQIEVSVATVIPIHAPQFEKSRRAHKSLPDPLKLEITFEEVNGTKSVITLINHNEPLDLVTKEKQQERHSKKQTLFWAQCDDLELETRTWASIYFDDDKTRLEVRSGDINKSKYLYRSDIKKLGWKAAQDQTTEVEIEDLHYESKGLSSRVWGLVDLQTQRCFCLKFELKTTTSSLVDYFTIPQLNPS